MRHRNSKTILGRKAAPRKALVRDLVTSLILHERIKTTNVKARVLRPKIERLITRARKGTLAERRFIQKVVRTEAALKKMMESIGPRYKTRNGGYTRILKLGQRKGDNASMVMIELIK